MTRENRQKLLELVAAALDTDSHATRPTVQWSFEMETNDDGTLNVYDSLIHPAVTTIYCLVERLAEHLGTTPLALIDSLIWDERMDQIFEDIDPTPEL